MTTVVILVNKQRDKQIFAELWASGACGLVTLIMLAGKHISAGLQVEVAQFAVRASIAVQF